MHKNENILFAEEGMRSCILRECYLQEYIAEHSSHSVLFSQWLLHKNYIDKHQADTIYSKISQEKSVAQAITNVNTQTDNSIESEKAKPENAQSPKCISNYQIISVLGQGGMGKVYKVLDLKTKKELALKVNFAGDQSSKAAIRFQREAKTMAKLDHPGIVKAYDIGCENNQMFFTMDLVPGVSLKELQQTKPMSIKQSVNFMIQVCEIMDYAHRNGVVHRDLKPGNIMVDNGKPIIMDFGLAKLDEVSQKLSKTGVMMGTLRYMPPEQVEGRHSATTAQSDLYSIGAILYEVLARRPIFTAKGHAALLNHIFNKEPIPLSEINPKIPKELEDICTKALSKQRKQRYQSCHTMAKDLRQLYSQNNDTRSRRTGKIRAKTIAKHKDDTNVKKVALALFAVGCVFFILLMNYDTKDNPSNQKQVLPDANERVLAKQKPTEKVEEKIEEKGQEKSEEKGQERYSRRYPADKLDWSRAITGFYLLNGNFQWQGHTSKIVRQIDVSPHPQSDKILGFCTTTGKLSIEFELRYEYEKVLVGFVHIAGKVEDFRYSPIDVYVNKKPVLKSFVPPLSGGYDEFDITNEVVQGKNLIEINSAADAKSEYYLFSFGIFEDK